MIIISKPALVEKTKGFFFLSLSTAVHTTPLLSVRNPRQVEKLSRSVKEHTQRHSFAL